MLGLGLLHSLPVWADLRFRWKILNGLRTSTVHCPSFLGRPPQLAGAGPPPLTITGETNPAAASPIPSHPTDVFSRRHAPRFPCPPSTAAWDCTGRGPRRDLGSVSPFLGTSQEAYAFLVSCRSFARSSDLVSFSPFSYLRICRCYLIRPIHSMDPLGPSSCS